MKCAVVVFPGSNCDRDAHRAVVDGLGEQAVCVRHDANDLGDVDMVILPGGFSYGDYLRPGAIARFAPVMEAVAAFAGEGGPVLGICNGFQILCEVGLLPGVLRPNAAQRFVCRPVHLRVENAGTPFTGRFRPGQVIRLPIAHGQGNYFAPVEVLEELEREGRIVFRYCDERGNVTSGANPNGSVRSIAGICNRRGNVLGLMPHPERAVERYMTSTDGLELFRSVRDWLMSSRAKAVTGDARQPATAVDGRPTA
ncbi:MAG: phosphoribosylformylglycinamidine synthase subunit PurQ [Firmicutes bacterium]|nr:phosphoribosylformylglycinamidine synthase subunit PurQ [Bacillota bacterium]